MAEINWTSNGRPKTSDVVAQHLPEFVRAEYPTFVAFIEAYYEYLDNQLVNLKNLRDIDNTLNDFIQYFKKELAHNYPIVSANYDTERFLLKNIKDQYLAKGSEASYKLLFRLLYGKDVYMDYPGQQMLRVSDGRWQQDVSIFVRVDQGDPISLIGKTVTVQTSKRIYNPEVVANADATARITANIENVLVFDAKANIYEFFLDRNFYGDILPGDSVKYGSEFQGQILPCTAKLKITNPGQDFRPGQVFQVSSGEGTAFWFKVLETTASENGLKTIDVIKFALGYTTDFSVNVLPTSAVSTRKKVQQTSVGVSYQIVNDVMGYITVTSGGANYQQVPDVIIDDPDGTGATAHAVLDNGVVSEIVVDTLGQGYTAPTITIQAQTGDTGSGAEAEAYTGDRYDYTYVDETEGFTESGYVNVGDYWDVTEHGRGAQATTTVSNGEVDSVTLLSGGSNYAYGTPVIDVAQATDSNGHPTGRKAVIEPTVVDGIITALTITDGGEGYTSPPLIRIRGQYGYADGAYVGTVDRQFFIDAADTISGNPALLNVSLGAIAKYPGYYKTNDGFLDDSMFIQDSYYYQAFAYVLKIDEQLESYASVVRGMLHPAGMAMFGEYSINNNIALGVALTSLVKSLGITLYDIFDPVDEGTTYWFWKDLNTEQNIAEVFEKLVFYKVLEDSFTMTDPAIDFSKVLGLKKGFDSDEVNQRVIMTEELTQLFSKRTTDDTVGVPDNLDEVSHVTGKNFGVAGSTTATTESVTLPELIGLNVGINIANDAMSGVFNEDGYVVINPYDEGGYFSEIYANGRASTFSV